MSHYAMATIRSDLITRIDAIAGAAGRIGLTALWEQIDTIRRLARQHRLDRVEGLAGMLETATAYDGHGPIILSYLDRMREAVDMDEGGTAQPIHAIPAWRTA